MVSHLDTDYAVAAVWDKYSHLMKEGSRPGAEAEIVAESKIETETEAEVEAGAEKTEALVQIE